MQMSPHIFVKRNALNPVHQQHGELRLVTIGCVNEQLSLKELDGDDEFRRNKLKLIRNLLISLVSSLLLSSETFKGIELPVPLIFHLKDYCEVPTAHHGIAPIIKHQPQIGQLLQILLGQLNRLNIFRNQRIIHALIVLLQKSSFK